MTTLMVLVVCIGLNATLAGLEAAFMSVSKAQIRTRSHSDINARRLLRLRERPERSLAVIQIGITFVSIVSGAVGGIQAHASVGPVIERVFDLSPGAATTLAVFVVAVPLMFLTILAGELVPKTFALRHAESVALAGARWLLVLERVFLPLVSLFAWATRIIVSALPQRHTPPTPVSPVVSGYALNIVDLGERRVRDAMVPWDAAIAADAAMPAAAIAKLVHASGHTRLPVVDQGPVIGLLHTKELLSFLAAGQQDWRALIRPIVTVDPDDPLLRVLRLLQAHRSHLAIVRGTGDIPAGLVTLEDIIEEVVGDLYDEDDDRAVAQLLAARGRRPGRMTGD